MTWMQGKAICQEKWVNLCVCILMWRGSFCSIPNGGSAQWGLFCVLPVATTVVQRTPKGEKSSLQPPGVSMDAPPGLLHTLQLVCVEGLISCPYCPLCQTRDASVPPSTSAWGLTPVTGTGAAGVDPRLSGLFNSTQEKGFSNEGRE